ncbi:dual specificity protein phosphatase family protein [Epilithonimonas arachidiradicis]|uniref:Dual specificity protein phosphatase-like protein n=1 Tax=Epilithonimonas arachidiradicis TaxID=1617282 RepID=A0A420DC79_9FLAO|nr:dual specificity protein phosphatase family protein [Epilithonimonas arachidiradicis]RKE89052.1 dual specificity protein phosphatase-like protein [Epilithonimonas arachidiradicis]
MSLNLKSTALKKIIFLFTVIAILISAFVYYQKKLRHNLVTISEGKVYNSGVVPPGELKDFLKNHGIKSVIDLRDGEEQTELNPETKKQVGAEENAIDKISNVNYFNLPTDQIPQDSTVQKFLKIMDDPKNYPVLIHCHHGVGRSRLFSSIYRIEYENFSNEDARSHARYLWELSGNFSKNSSKGKYLLNYKKRK